MSLTFDEALQLFQSDDSQGLAADPDGRRFLKLRTLSRQEHLVRLYGASGLEPPALGVRELFRQSFEDIRDDRMIEQCIKTIYEEGRKVRREQEPGLIDQLYRLQEFNWGGLHQNSLEKTII